MTSLADLYDADERAVRECVRQLADKVYIPHPLNGVQYADGISPCRHAKKHTQWQACSQDVRPEAVTPPETPALRFSSPAGVQTLMNPANRAPDPEGPYVCSHVSYAGINPLGCDRDALPGSDRCENHAVADPGWGPDR